MIHFESGFAECKTLVPHSGVPVISSTIMTGSILLVDDDGEDATLICEAFGKLGLADELRHVKDGEEALKYFQGSEQYAHRELFPLPSLVLLDLRLPRMSGLEVLAWMRKQPALRTVIVVVLTGLQLDSEIQRAYLLGANSVLFKGTSQTQLDAKIKLLKDYWVGANQEGKSN
jgi:CheY-like chemotaxis protein